MTKIHNNLCEFSLKELLKRLESKNAKTRKTKIIDMQSDEYRIKDIRYLKSFNKKKRVHVYDSDIKVIKKGINWCEIKVIGNCVRALESMEDVSEISSDDEHLIDILNDERVKPLVEKSSLKGSSKFAFSFEKEEFLTKPANRHEYHDEESYCKAMAQKDGIICRDRQRFVENTELCDLQKGNELFHVKIRRSCENNTIKTLFMQAFVAVDVLSKNSTDEYVKEILAVCSGQKPKFVILYIGKEIKRNSPALNMLAFIFTQICKEYEYEYSFRKLDCDEPEN